MTVNTKADAIYEERMADYGHPLPNVEKAKTMWEAILGVSITDTQFTFCMIALKMARELDRHKEDNLIDIPGYMRVLEEVTLERARLEDSTDSTDS